MEYVKLGNSGLEVSKICIGCMSFGEPTRGNQPWSLPEKEAREIIKHALDQGINFFDTANVYSAGSSEEILGKAIKDFTDRDKVVIASKVYFPMFDGPNSKGLSRKAIFREIEGTLKRLQTDYLDLYIIHRFDPNTPLEETMKALHDLVQMGKVRYIGASSMYSWQFLKAQTIAKENGWTPFISMQNLYNLIYREEEREMIPLLKDQKIAMTPWSPLAKGKLARLDQAQTNRSLNDGIADRFFPESKSDQEIIQRVRELADKRNVSPAQIALAWEFSKDYVTSILIGSSKIKHIGDAISALNITLTKEEIDYLEEPYVPHAKAGF